MPSIPCPKCGHKIADQINTMFKVSYIEKGRKNTDTLFMLPVTTACGACFKQHRIKEPPSERVICGCPKGSEYIAAPYQSKRRSGNWVSVHLPAIQRSVDCADALLVCRNGTCDARMFLSEYVATGKTIATIAEEKAAWTTYVDGSMVILGFDNPPQEAIDATV